MAWIPSPQPPPTGGTDTAEQAQGELPGAKPFPDEEERTPAQLAQARSAEVMRAWATVGPLASAGHSQGARLRFRWWKEDGALTLLHYKALRELRPQAQAPQRPEALEHEVKQLLGELPNQHSGAVEVELRRMPAEWAVNYRTVDEAPTPPERRRRPVNKQGVAAPTWQRVREVAARLMKPLQVPQGGEARLEAEVKWEDGRLVDAEIRNTQVVRRGGRPHGVEPQVVEEVTWVLLGLSEGLGPRTVRLQLRAMHQRGEVRAHAWIEEAEVVRPEQHLMQDEDFAVAYYAMHEEILRRWREELKDGSQWVLRQTAEELALWYVGGIIGKGGGALLEFLPKVMQAVLARGGPEASGWLRSAMVRLSPVEKESFQRLWSKLLVEGEEALTHSERHALRQTMLLLEQRLNEQLSDIQSRELRAHARALYMKSRRELTSLMRTRGDLFPVHHQCPLEYAHRFPELDINGIGNLAMVHKNVHTRISALWTTFRQKRPSPSAEDVDKMVKLIHKHFKDWFDKADVPEKLPQAVLDAESAARLEMRSLFL